MDLLGYHDAAEVRTGSATGQKGALEYIVCPGGLGLLLMTASTSTSAMQCNVSHFDM